MVVLPQATVVCSGSILSKLSFSTPKYTHKLCDFRHVKAVSSKRFFVGNIRKSTEFGKIGFNHGIWSGRDFYQSSSDNDLPQEPWPLLYLRLAIWSVKDVFDFLVEQPSQLKYIEWPRFTSTLKTAILALVLVAVLIVALSSIDSALGFLLAFILRRPA